MFFNIDSNLGLVLFHYAPDLNRAFHLNFKLVRLDYLTDLSLKLRFYPLIKY